MSTIWIKKFGGVDVRRLPEMTDSDALIRGNDGHLTRGGEFEKRAAFVPTYTLPANTKGLAADASSIYVFGSNTTPVGLPSGVAYQQLAYSFLQLSQVVTWDLFKNKIYAVGQFTLLGPTENPHFYNGAVVGQTAVRSFAEVSLAFATPGSTITISVDGVAVMAAPLVLSGVVATDTAALVAAINSFSSAPEYIADTDGAIAGSFMLRAAITGTAANGKAVVATTTGLVVVFLTPATMVGGAAGYTPNSVFVRTIGAKMYALSGSLLEFSAIGDPTDWSVGTGFGFIDTSAYTAGSEVLTAIAEFRGAAAVFSQRTIQIWSLASDPAGNSLQQRLRNTGTSCPKSLTQFGDNDMFYLAENGLRSLRATPSLSGALAFASTYAAGARIDPLIVAKLRSLTEAERATVIGLIEPNTGNFWLVMKDVIYVYAYFPQEGVSGWSVYNPGFTITDAVVFNRRIYLRSGDIVYVYGGLATGTATDSTQAEAWTAYMDDGTPTADKKWKDFDAAVSGVWALSVGMDPTDTSTFDNAAILTETTYNNRSIGAIGSSTHISLRFKSQGSGPAVLGTFALRYEPDE